MPNTDNMGKLFPAMRDRSSHLLLSCLPPAYRAGSQGLHTMTLTTLSKDLRRDSFAAKVPSRVLGTARPCRRVTRHSGSLAPSHNLPAGQFSNARPYCRAVIGNYAAA
jgi:hypothetical protein